ncbi:hypothetical protein [Streptomyces violaceusniger]|uniref:UL36 very large tegument protein n=1 Tax=Streptomyces violaceusniger (strain Tu 4113) TaxID=653045 RepID=G2PCL7_STRV4|nr:hypothetical protein [Streptomyces violaceusniger]AEM82195.1 hypothetical protein Strvi_2475 [Streptomyces violaceusniger Tu 4113]
MASGQLPAEVEEFASYLRALTRRLDAGTGWYGVFALRDPEGLRACLDGLEVPPWDVVQSLLQDLSTQRGAGPAQEAAARAATLYRASVAAHDAGPGSREALQDRLDGMLREQRNAARRERDLQAAVSAAEGAADRERLGAELAWAHDDWRRATARTEELHARLTALTPRPSQPPPPQPGPPTPAAPPPAGPTPTAQAPAPRPTAPTGPTPTAPAPAPRPLAPTTGPTPPDTSASAVGSGADASAEPPAQGLRPAPPASTPAPWPAAPAAGPTPPGTSVGAPAPAPAPAAGSARPVPRGAWFAGVEEVGAAPGPSVSEAAVEATPPDTPALGVASGADVAFEVPVQGREPVPPAPASASPRLRGARFAGAGGGGTAALLPSSPAPPPAESGTELPATPRGARFAGAYDGEGGGKRRKRDKAADDGRRLAREAAERAAARRAAQEAVARVGRLRVAGRSGEAHAVLCEAAAWPAPRLPVLAEELERAGLGADVSTLLWEMACLPPGRLAAAAEALVAADREADGERLLRQSVSRPVPEVAHTAQALLAAGVPRRAAFLLEALVRARTPEEAARAAAEDPATLVPLLLDAAAGVSSSSYHDLAHALRAAGLPGVPGLA